MTNLRDTVIAAVRTGFFVFLTALVPGVIGWLNDVTAWLNSDGGTPFPDPSILRTVLFAAGSAGAVAVMNALGIVLQNRFGLGKTPEYTSATPVSQ